MNEENKNELSISEPEWQARFRGEYKELKERYNKLHRMIVKYDAGTLDFKPTCPIDLLRRQKATMGEYLNILEIRAEIENVRGLDDDKPKLKRNECISIAKKLGIVDWPKIEVDTPIFVRDSNEEVWKCRYFAMYEDGEIYAWQLGRTSWSNPIKRSPIAWKYAKLAGDTDE